MTAFGPYELQGLLGRGGMGEVHRAYDREQARVVALKLLPAAMATDEGFVERFKRESYAAAQLNDPHVLPIHRYGEIEGRLYIDMRLVEGRDLAELIAREGPLPPVRAVSIVAQAAQALDAAHARRLVHRDVKPSNLLLTSQDFVYLVDFGIAQVGGSDARPLTAAGAAVGTFDYMAPERLHGGAEVDGRADVYSLACVLHEALTGRRPFPVAGVPALVHAHLSTPPPRVTALRPDLPAGLDAVVARGMAKSPADRYATCGELAADAVRVLQGAPPRVPVAVVPSAAPTVVPGAAAAVQAPPTYVPPAPPSTWPPAATQPPERRGRGTAAWLVAATALVVAAVLAGVLLGQRGSGGDGAAADTVATDSAAPAAPSSPPDPSSEEPAEDPEQDSTPAPRTASEAPSTPAPRTGPARGDLGLAVPISQPACDSSWVVFLGSSVTPGRYAAEISGFLSTHPGASYLLTAGSCSSLRQDLDGALIYAAYTGPFPSQAAACAERARVGGESYVKRLDDTTPSGQLWTC